MQYVHNIKLKKIYVLILKTLFDGQKVKTDFWRIENIYFRDKAKTGENIIDLFAWLKKMNGGTIYIPENNYFVHLIDWMEKNGYSRTEKEKLEENQYNCLISQHGDFYNLKICLKAYKQHSNINIFFLNSMHLFKYNGFDFVKYSTNININDEIKQSMRIALNDYAKKIYTLIDMGLTKMTLGACSISFYKEMIGGKKFKYLFPNSKNGEYERKAYRGGFLWLNPKYERKIIGSGIRLDYNTMYGTIMKEELLPYDEGIYFKGKYKKDAAHPIYIQTIQVSFDLKPNHVPSLSISGLDGRKEYINTTNDESIEITLTNIDLEVLFKQYTINYIKYIDGIKYKASNQHFKGYIEHWDKIKEAANKSGDKFREKLAKHMITHLQGKFAAKPNYYNKVPILKEDKIKLEATETKYKPEHYAILSAFITAYGRRKIITIGQKEYNRYIYTDTDSIVLEGVEIPEYLEISPNELGKLKVELTFKRAKFVTTKGYILEEANGDCKIYASGLPEVARMGLTVETFGEKQITKPESELVAGGIKYIEKTFKFKEY